MIWTAQSYLWVFGAFIAGEIIGIIIMAMMFMARERGPEVDHETT